MDTALQADIRDSILDTIGATPLVRLSRIAAGLKPQDFVAKLEMFNPGGSIKDRVALRLIEAAQGRRAAPGGTLIEPTSSNTGTGLAIAARLKGYRVIAVMPDKMSREKIDLLRAYGAEVVIAPTDVAPESPQSYRVADRLTEEIPAHLATEPVQERREPADALRTNTAAAGARPAAASRTSSPASERAARSPAWRATCASRTRTSSWWERTRSARSTPTRRSTRTSSRESARTSGRRPTTRASSTATSPSATRTASSRRAGSPRPRGCSSATCGLAVHAALELARETDDEDALIAVILPDGGRAYLSKIFNDTWMASHGMFERTSDRTAGDVLRAKQAAGEIPPLVVVETQQKVKDAIALLHEHRVSQLPVVSHTDPSTVVGSIGERRPARAPRPTTPGSSARASTT